MTSWKKAGYSSYSRQRSDHWILAAEYQFSSFSTFEAEIFYKSMQDLKPRYENLFNPYVFLPEMEPDRFTIEATRAYAKGIELSYSATYDQLEWNVNYSYSKVQDFEDGRWIDRRWDQPHRVNGRFTWHPGNFDVGIAAAWHTGWRFTRLPENLLLEPGQQVSSIRSNARLNNFSTIDCRIAYEFQFANSTLMTFFEVTNILNATNEGGIEYEISEGDDEFVLEEVDLEPVFPLVSSIGLVWRF